MIEALIGLAAIMILAVIRVPIALAMALVGFVGLGYMRDWNSAAVSISTVMYESGFQYSLSVMPLFILMGNFVTRAGMSQGLYRLAYTLVAHLRGGLLLATVLACAGFSAICGSSIATAATMTKVAYPSMMRYGYAPGPAASSIAVGGTLGILIPPSVILILYGLMTDTNIGALFAAGVIPGLLATVLFLLAAVWICWRNPEQAPAGEKFSWRERLGAAGAVWPVVVLFIVVMGGIYGGVFTATEGAGIGAFGAFVAALWARQLTLRTLYEILKESATTTATMFAIMIGALIFANFVTFTTLSDDLIGFVTRFDVAPIAVVIAICVIYVLLGTIMEEISMIMLTIPVFFPLVVGLGFDPVWFGILIGVVMMTGMVSPPVGMNLFVVRNLVGGVQLGELFKAVVPYIVAQLVLLAILIAAPAVVMWLPHALGL